MYEEGEDIFNANTDSRGSHMSAIVPPTMMAPVEPEPPAINRATRTVWMFLDLKNYLYQMANDIHIINCDLQSDHEVHENVNDERPDIKWTSAYLFAERSRYQRKDGEAERVQCQTNSRLKIRAVQVSRHGWEPKVVRRCSGAFDRVRCKVLRFEETVNLPARTEKKHPTIVIVHFFE